MHLLFLLITYLLHPFYCLEVDEGLVGVAVIYRHGDRTPIKTYPTDPYSNSSYWPVGFGELTNIGKLQLFELGQWFRNRYRVYLSDQYSSKDVYVLSTDVARALMSAQLNLAGLFPPRGKQIWNNNLAWQPIPVHTTPEIEDNILRMKMPCAKYKYLFDKLLESDEFVEINNKNRDLYQYLSNYSGMSIKNIGDLEHLYSTLSVENRNNLTLPEWTKSVFPDKMAPWAHLSFALKCYTPELARLKSGPLLSHIFDNFLKRTNGKGYKFLAYSAHDTTVANILTALNVFEYHSPPYGATVFFELRYLNESYFVDVLYKNSSVIQKLCLKDCEFLCPLKTFRKILKPLLLTPEQWYQECLFPKSIVSRAAFSNGGFLIFFIAFILVCSCILAVCIKNKVARCRYRVIN